MATAASAAVPKKKKMSKWLQTLISVGVGLIIALLPVPAGLERPALIYMGIFFAFILLNVFETFPIHISALLALVALVVTKVCEPAVAFGPYASSTVWLLIGVFGFGAAIGNSGLLKRVAFTVLSWFPATYNGSILALMASGIAITPLVPSNTAKTVLMMSIAKEINDFFGFEKDSKASGGLFSATYMTNALFGIALLSGSLIAPMVMALTKVTYGWFQWLSYGGLWGVIILVGSYLFIKSFFKSETATDLPKTFFKDKLAELGPMGKKEIISGVILAVTLILWILEKQTGLSVMIVTIAAMCALSITGVFPTQEFGTKISWPLIVLVGAILTLAGQLSALGVDKWIASVLSPVLGGIGGNAFVLVFLCVILTYLMRYFIISTTATTMILMIIFGATAAASGIDMFVIVFCGFVSGQLWNLSFNQTVYLAAEGASGGMVTWKKTGQPLNYFYMVINLIALLASVPVWMAVGLIK